MEVPLGYPEGKNIGFFLVIQVYMKMRRPRFLIEPGDVSPAQAARRMGLAEADFQAALPELLLRGFPQADPTTGNFDLTAIDEWRHARHKSPRPPYGAANADDVVLDRIQTMLSNG